MNGLSDEAPAPMYDETLTSLVAGSIERLCTDVHRFAPFMADRLLRWITRVSPSANPEDYFTNADAFPSVLLPWWLARTIVSHPDTSFDADLVYSTVNGCYYVRLIDNVMDEQSSLELALLPAAAFFHMQFQGVYQRHFPSHHQFWDEFRAQWAGSSETAMQDASLDTIDRDRFMAISAKKVCAAKIPLAAVCYHYNRPALIPPWSRFCDVFGCFTQMMDDVFDWYGDMSRGTATTYFLSEADKRKRPDESIAHWVVNEGFQWGIEMVRGWLKELQDLSCGLDSIDLQAYLAAREAMLLKREAYLASGLRGLADLARVMK